MAKRNTSTKKSVKKASKRASAKAVKASRKPTKPSPKAVKKSAPAKKPSPRFHSPYPRSEHNQFREGSSYATCVDILAAHKDGMTRQALVEELAKVTGKKIKNAAFDAAVILSARPDSRHPSCRPGFVVDRENDHVRLRTP